MAGDQGSYHSQVRAECLSYGPPLATMRASPPTTEPRWIKTDASPLAREREEYLGSYVHALGTGVPDDVVPPFSSLVSSQTSVTTRSRPARFLFAIHVTEVAGMADVRLVLGGQLPRFFHVNQMVGMNKNVEQLWGLPVDGDEGAGN